MEEGSCEKTTLITMDGLYEFVPYVPFRLCNSPVPFQRLLQITLVMLGVISHFVKCGLMIILFLNQALAGHRPVRTWFLRIAPVLECRYACVCVCPPPRLLITSGVMWCDIDPI